MKQVSLLLTSSIICALIMLPVTVKAVVVTNVTELVNAVSSANAGGDKIIEVADGTYALDNMLWIDADGVTVYSSSGNRDSVTIRGEGMGGDVSHIFNVAGSDFAVRDMTIGWVANHAIQIQGNENAHRPLIQNLHIVDTFEQMIKVSYDPATDNRSEGGVVEGCLFEYSAGIGPQYYIGGIDAHRARNWIIRNNTFKNISSPSESVAEFAIHFWSDAEDTLVEGNTIINCDRGIGFGLGDRGHTRGIIRNNMIYHDAAEGYADVAISIESAIDSQIYNNTIYMEHSYPNAIEYRFPTTTGALIINNLTNKAITQRNSASATVSHNITSADQSWFANPPAGDLHLSARPANVIDQGQSISGLTMDFDGDPRPQGAGIDIGADEVNGEPGSTTTTATGLTTTTTTVEERPCPVVAIYGRRSPQTELLRIVREEHLSKTEEGREIIKLYYKWAPVMVKIIKEDEHFKDEIKQLIDHILTLIINHDGPVKSHKSDNTVKRLRCKARESLGMRPTYGTLE